jgi:hypothetical protein
MRAPRIIRTCACAVFALGLPTAAGAATTDRQAGTNSIVIAIPGAHGVVLVGPDHQAHKVTLRNRASTTRPGVIIRVTHPTAHKVFISNVGLAKGIKVFGVVAKHDSVRLADGTRLRGSKVAAGVAELKPGARVTVRLRFSQGKTKVRDVSAKSKHLQKSPKPKPKRHAKQRVKHLAKLAARGGHAKKPNHLQGDGSKKSNSGGKNRPRRHRPGRTPHQADVLTDVRTLDGSNNNVAHRTWGQAGTPYPRAGAANYADGVSVMQGGPSPRRISDRVFNDVSQNLFSENNISQWGWVWGQFIDHDIGLRDETPAEDAAIPFDAADPLELFANDLGKMAFNRTPAAPGTGTSRANPRQEINTNTSVIDASQVYGGTAERLAWLKASNGYDLFLPGGYLPHASDKAGAPGMDLMGPLMGNAAGAIVAGDVRANENTGLTSIQTLFAREHNRIADSLPDTLSAETRFQIARRVVGAEIQYITYREFLPAIGVPLPSYSGYKPSVDPSIVNEFATTGFRAHSMVHGEFEPTFEGGAFTLAQLGGFAARGAQVEVNDDASVTVVIPLGLAFGNPDLVKQLDLGPLLGSLAETEYRNDEQIDNALRSVLFQIPRPTTTDPSACHEPGPNPACFSNVGDVGALDVQRARDHGIPTYNQLRALYGLAPIRSFTQLTGEETDEFPRTDEFPQGLDIDNSTIMDFVSLTDAEGNPVELGDPEGAVTGVRRTTLAARLKALYGSVDKVDGFVGMISEPHIPGSELGPLQRAMWRRQFAALRDGDRFFYLNDPALERIEDRYDVSYKHTLAEIVELNTDTDVQADIFHGAE